MYNLVELSDGKWRFEAERSNPFEGNFKSVVKFASKFITLDQIEFGLLDANRKCQDTCHFGINGYYLYCYSQAEKKVRNVS